MFILSIMLTTVLSVVSIYLSTKNTLGRPFITIATLASLVFLCISVLINSVAASVLLFDLINLIAKLFSK